MMCNKTTEDRFWNARNSITIIITLSVILATIYLCIYETLINPKDSELTEKTLIPLWATWIGTVLAFYFGKTNFDTATKSYKNIIDKLSADEKLQKVAVCDAMIPFDKIVAMDFEDSENLTIEEILENPKFFLYNRYAFFDDNGKIREIIHRKNFTQYVTDMMKGKDDCSKNPLKTTFKEYLEQCDEKENKGKKWKGTPVFISIESNMLDAKNEIFSIPNNRDVFVTRTGKGNEEILGLITDEDILKAIKS